MGTKDLVGQVASETGLGMEQAEQAVNAVFEGLTAAMARGEAVHVTRFGTFYGEKPEPHRGPQSSHRGAHRDSGAQGTSVQTRQEPIGGC
jgi:nucleoid DNA-binding protein